MRILIDILIALMLMGILAGFFMESRSQQEQSKVHEYVHSEVQRFQQQIEIQAAMGHALSNRRSYPDTIDPEWFSLGVPQNTLLEPGHPWVEIASKDDCDLLHPRDRIVTNSSQAQFWYNPVIGVVRARVPAQVSDQDTLDLYNFINDSSLTDLFRDERKPVSLASGENTSH
ncbi:MAG TPA: hypothetical protein VG711_01020 [Phycisphaerales bacterium]|nr:hypothetical protein [Phycisphaerales bacterium]